MSNEMTIFTNNDFGQVRTIIKDGEPWFVAADVCRVFCVANNRLVTGRLEEDEKGVCDVDTPGGKQKMTIINESGLYHMLFTMEPNNARGITPEEISQRKDQLRKFKRWVTHEVLPSIRKTGGYGNFKQLIIDQFDFISDETKKALIIDLYGKTDELIVQTEQLAAKIEEDKPKVELANQIEASVTSLLIRDFCKVIQKNSVNIGEKRLYQWLIENKYLNDQKLPYQRYIDYFEVVERVFARNGVTYLSHTTRITGKGQVYFTEKLIREFSKNLVPVA